MKVLVAGEVKGRLDLLFARVAALHASKAGACVEQRAVSRMVGTLLLLLLDVLIDRLLHPPMCHMHTRQAPLTPSSAWGPSTRARATTRRPSRTTSAVRGKARATRHGARRLYIYVCVCTSVLIIHTILLCVPNQHTNTGAKEAPIPTYFIEGPPASAEAKYGGINGGCGGRRAACVYVKTTTRILLTASSSMCICMHTEESCP